MCETKFQVGYARSGRSHCKKCRELIDDGRLRIGVTTDYTKKLQVCWYHVDCLFQTSLAKCCPMQSVPGFAQLTLSDQDQLVRKFSVFEEDDELELGLVVKRQKKAVVPAPTIDVSSTAASSPDDCKPPDTQCDVKVDTKPDIKVDVKPDLGESKPSISEKAKSYLDRLVAKAEEKKADDDDDKPAKAKRTRRHVKPADWLGYTQEQYTAYKKTCERLGAKSTDELREICKLNEQKVSGSKLDLIERVADGRLLGSIPRCKTCSKAVLRFNPRNGEYSCPGYMNHSEYVSCTKKFEAKDITRGKWLE